MLRGLRSSRTFAGTSPAIGRSHASHTLLRGMLPLAKNMSATLGTLSLESQLAASPPASAGHFGHSERQAGLSMPQRGYLTRCSPATVHSW